MKKLYNKPSMTLTVVELNSSMLTTSNLGVDTTPKPGISGGAKHRFDEDFDNFEDGSDDWDDDLW